MLTRTCSPAFLLGFTLSVPLCSSLLAAGCQRVSERQLRDTEGRVFSAKCNREGSCAFTRLPSTDKSEFVLRDTGRLIGICSAGADRLPQSPTTCRALVCNEDRDCPPAHGLKDGQCLNGHCANPAQAINVDDSVMMCLAGLGLGHDDQKQIERYALGVNCGTPCRVPTPCQRP
ncbi:MAG TPA: hypothetical protein VGI10_26775 [Polyangiaceae bacterium]